jgi:cytoskeletal protein CcmA (bactofilin family)
VAASIEQKLDFLLKKIGYVASKTGIAEDSTLSGTKKAPFGEAIPSPLVVPESSIWAQANEIPATPPGSNTSYVRVYLSGSSGHRMTVDNTVSGNRTFIARSTYNDNSSSILGDWIDTSFGADYIIEVYKGDPNSGGVKLSAAGSGSNDTWFFDYSSGVLNFNGTVVPSGVTSTNIYIVGYRYIGIKGVAVPGAGATFTHATIGDLNITGVSTFFDTTDNTLGNENTGSVQLDGGMGIAKNLTVKQNLHVGGYSEFVGVATFKGGTINLGDADTDDINVSGEFISNLVPDVDDTYSLGTASKQWKNLFINGHAELDNTVISGVSTFSSSLDINSDVDIDGHTELDNVNIAGVTTFQSNAFFGDADYIQMGDSQDLKIGHVGSYSVILDQGEGNLSIGGDGFVDIMNTALNEYKARFTTNGSVELYFDNVNKFETTGYGATVFGTLQSQQLNVTGVSTFQSHVHFGDDDELRFGASNDFKIYHDPDDARLENSNGDVKFKNTGSYFFFDEDGGETLASFINDGGVNLYYGGSKKFETTGYGATVFGTLQSQQLNVTGVSTFSSNVSFSSDIDSHLIPASDDTYDLGAPNDQWRNLYIDGLANVDQLLCSTSADFSNNVEIGGDLKIADKIVHIGDTNTAIRFPADDTFTVETAGSERLRITSDGKLIHGVSSSSYDLTTAGNGYRSLLIGSTSGSTAALLLDGASNGDGTGNDYGSIEHNSGGELRYKNRQNAGHVFYTTSSDTERLRITSSGKIGINSTAPSERLDVGGTIKTEQLNVTGVSTFAGTVNTASIVATGIDLNGDIDVDGHTNLDNVSVAGVTTTSGLLDINAGGQANTFKVEDLTDNRVVIAGTGGELEDDANLTFNGSTLAVGVDLDVDGHTNLDNVSVAGVTTFTGAIDANGNLDVDGTTELDVLNVAETATFSANIDANGDLDVDGHTNLDNVSVAGVSTFTGAIDADGNVDVAGTLDVDGHTELDNVNISGIATATAFHTGAEGSAIRVTSNTISGPAEMFIDPAGVGDNTGALRIKGDLFVDGTQTVINSTTIELGDFIVGIATTATTDSLADGAGIKIGPDNTFLYDHPNTSLKSSENLNLASSKVYKIDGTDVLSATTLGSGVVNSSLTSLGTLLGLTVSGQTTLNTLGVTGVSTFSGAIDANGDLDVDGHTNLDNLSVAGVSTFQSDVHFGDDDKIIFGDGDDLQIYHDGNNSYIEDAGVGALIMKGSTIRFRSTTNENIISASQNGAVDLYYDNSLKFQTTGYGATVFGTTQTQQLNVTGVSTIFKANGSDLLHLTRNTSGGGTDIGFKFNVNNPSANSTTLGITRISGNTSILNITDQGVVYPSSNGTVDLGRTSNRFDNFYVLNIDANGDLDVNGHTELDNVAISGITTFTGTIDANGNVDVAGILDVDGHTELDNVNISGVVTATSINATTFIGNGDFVDIDVDGHTELDNVNIAGVVTATTINATTFAGNGDFVDIDVDGHTDLDNVSVAGVTTFAGRIVGAATSNVIPFLYSTFEGLPNAGTYHGAFAHVHNRGKGYFAHANAWYELVNKELNGTVGTGTERYDVEYIDAAGSNVTGVSTAATSVAATLNVGAGGTVLNASINNSRVGINSTTPAYALDVVGDINSSTDIKVNGVSIVVPGTPASTDDVVALAIALG